LAAQIKFNTAKTTVAIEPDVFKTSEGRQLLDATYRAHTGPVHNRRRGCIFIRERQNFKLARDRLFRREAPASEEIVADSGPSNPSLQNLLGWQQITNDWRERARAETCVRLSA
jgi:hypothetical protein